METKMATFSILSYTFSFNLQIFIFLFLTSNPISSFALVNNPSFDPHHISLYGDARVENGSSAVHLTRPHAPSSGLLLHDKPFKFAGNPMSFSAEFTFSLSHGNADGLALVFVPNGFQTRFHGQGSFGLFGENMFLGIEFDTKRDDKVRDFNANHVGIDVKSLESIKVRDLSSRNLVLNNGVKLKSWVDYDSSSKLLQIRLSKFDEKRPFSPILAYHIDLLEMWGDKDVFVGIVSTSDDESSNSISNVYSWRFRVRHVSSSMHSLPADPRGDELKDGKRKFCVLTFLAGLIFGTGCGALFAFVVLFMWAISVSRHMVFPVEFQANHEDFRYEKVDVIVEKCNGFDKN